jgi:hypothetical protein
VSFSNRAALRPYEGYTFSQLGEGGTNAIDNCGPACFSDVLAAYYTLHTKPQWWTDNEYGPSYHGGEDATHLIDWMHKNPEDFPNPPSISVSNPNDTIAALDGAGSKGYAIVALVHCNATAQLQDHWTGIFHWVIVAALDSVSVTIVNPWQGVEQAFALDFFRKACSGTVAGLLIIFQRALVAPAGTGGTVIAKTTDDIYNELRGDQPHSKLDMLYEELRGTADHSKLDLLLTQLGEVAKEVANVNASAAAAPLSLTQQVIVANGERDALKIELAKANDREQALRNAIAASQTTAASIK